MSERTEAAKWTDRDFDRDTLEAVASVQDAGEHGGEAPNWMLPARIPSQRLSGLARRGYLRYRQGRWSLTERGCAYIDELRSEL